MSGGFGSGNGPVSSAQFNDGQFNNGQFNSQPNGQFNAGPSQQLNNGQFNNGQFNNNGQLNNGQINNGQFNNGQLNNGQFNDQVRGSVGVQSNGGFKDYSGLIDPRTLPKDILATSEDLDTLDLTEQPGVNNNRAR